MLNSGDSDPVAVVTYGGCMDQLGIINEELQAKRSFYDSLISEITEDRDRLRSELSALRESRDREIAELTSAHETQIAELKSQHSANKQHILQTHAAELEARTNHDLAERLLYESKCDDEIQSLSSELQSLAHSQEASQSQTMQETDAALLQIRSQVRISRAKARSLRDSIDEVTALVNDKFRKGALTAFGRDIRRFSNEAADLALQFSIRVDRLNEQFERAAGLNKFRLRKLRQEIADTKMRQQRATQQIDQLNEEHAHQMRELRIRILKLTRPTPIRVPDHRNLDRMRHRIAELERGAEESRQTVRGLDATYRKLKNANQRLRREKRRIEFLVGFPSGRPSAHLTPEQP
jgi:chromosome segregation ATPase